MLTNHILLALLWIIYCVLHSLMASISVKKWFREKLGNGYKFYRPAYVIFSFVFLAAMIYFQAGMQNLQLFDITTPVFIAGILFGFAGLSIMMVCIAKYFVHLSGLRSLVEERPVSQLMVTGIHRYVRHPLYLGTFVFIWGMFLLLPYSGLLISNTIITVYTLIGIKLEERKLLEEYGSAYMEYRKKVPMLLPFLKHGYVQRKSVAGF